MKRCHFKEQKRWRVACTPNGILRCGGGRRGGRAGENMGGRHLFRFGPPRPRLPCNINLLASASLETRHLRKKCFWKVLELSRFIAAHIREVCSTHTLKLNCCKYIVCFINWSMSSSHIVVKFVRNSKIEFISHYARVGHILGDFHFDLITL